MSDPTHGHTPLGYAGPKVATPPPALPAPPPPPPSTWRTRLLGWVLFIGLAVLVVSLVRHTRGDGTAISLDIFADKLKVGDVQSIEVGEDDIAGNFTSPQYLPKYVPNSRSASVTRFRVTLPRGGGSQLLPWIMEHRGLAEVQGAPTNSLLMDTLLPFVPWMLIFGFIWFFVFRPLRSAGKAAQARPQQPVPVVIVNPEAQ